MIRRKRDSRARGATIPPVEGPMGRRVSAPAAAARGRNRANGAYKLRRRLMLGSMVAAALVITARATELQVIEARDWVARAHEQQSQRLELPAPRGTIYDRDGVPLATSQEAYRLAIAPREIADRCRGFQPWPGTWTTLGGSRLTIWSAAPVGGAAGGEPGEVLEAKGDRLVVACGGGTALLARELQVEGRRRIRTRDALNGLRLAPGARLGS